MMNDIPVVSITKGILTISITATELKSVAKGHPEQEYIVTNPSKFLEELQNNLTYKNPESGLTPLQYLIDGVINELFEQGSENIEVKNPNPIN